MQNVPAGMPPGGLGGWPTPPVAPNDAKSVVSMVLGIVCLLGTFCWLGAPLGVPAIVLGALAHRDIRRSGGMVGGGGMATAGIVMGSVGSLVFACWGVFLIFAMWKARALAPAMAPAPVAGPGLGPAPAPTAVTAPTSLVPPGGWGRIHVTVLHPSAARTLRAQLADEARAAKAAGESVLVESVGPGCRACVEIARAMPEPELQAALAGVRLVHVDVEEFGLEASTMHLDTPSLPWFYLVDMHGAPRDGVSADEWDDNDADAIAPVLDAFVKGRLQGRRQTWGGTPL